MYVNQIFELSWQTPSVQLTGKHWLTYQTDIKTSFSMTRISYCLDLLHSRRVLISHRQHSSCITILWFWIALNMPCKEELDCEIQM
jgi:hypothetical protein